MALETRCEEAKNRTAKDGTVQPVQHGQGIRPKHEERMGTMARGTIRKRVRQSGVSYEVRIPLGLLIH